VPGGGLYRADASGGRFVMLIWVRASQRARAGELVPHSASRSALSALRARTRVPDVRSHTRMRGRDSLL